MYVCQESETILTYPQKLEPRVGGTSTHIYIRSVPGGESVTWLRLGRHYLVNLIPVAQRTETFT